MNNLKNIFNTELTPSVSTASPSVLNARKMVKVLGTIILAVVILGIISGGTLLIFFFPILSFVVPVFMISLIWWVVMEISDKLGNPDNAKNKAFLSKDWRKTVSIAFIIVLVAGVIMFRLLYKYYL